MISCTLRIYQETFYTSEEMELHMQVFHALYKDDDVRLLKLSEEHDCFIEYHVKEKDALIMAFGERELRTMKEGHLLRVESLILLMKYFKARRISNVYQEKFAGKITDMLANRKRSLTDNISGTMVFADIYRQSGAMVSNVWAKRSINEYYEYNAGVLSLIH